MACAVPVHVMMQPGPVSARIERNIVDRRYLLRREVGRGGTSVVHEAVHQITRRIVAIKRLHENLRTDPVQVGRVLREAEAIAAVRHPNVVRVIDAGQEEDGAPYIVLEYLEGRTLEGIIAARGGLSIFDSLWLTRQACSAVAAVHEAGFVHRDVKPGNFLVLPSGDGYGNLRDTRLKLIDFGIVTAPWFDGRQKLTREGTMMGTPEYMPIERLVGNPDSSKPAIDVYALGVTLYECLTGRAPYEGSSIQVITRALTEPITPLEKLCPDVPEVIVRIVNTALDRDPDKRFRDARVMEHALTAAIEEISKKKTSKTINVATGASRRRHVRAPYITPVRLEHEGKSLDGRTEDLSMGGVMVMLPELVPQGAQVTIRFALPTTGEYVRAAAIVRWGRKSDARSKTPCALGLEFQDLDARVKNAIEQFVRIVGREVERRG